MTATKKTRTKTSPTLRWSNALLKQLYLIVEEEIAQGKSVANGFRRFSEYTGTPLNKVDKQYYRIKRVYGSLRNLLILKGVMEGEVTGRPEPKKEEKLPEVEEQLSLNLENVAIPETQIQTQTVSQTEIESNLKKYLDEKFGEKEEVFELKQKIKELEWLVKDKDLVIIEQEGKIESLKTMNARLKNKSKQTEKDFLNFKVALLSGSAITEAILSSSEPTESEVAQDNKKVQIGKDGFVK